MTGEANESDFDRPRHLEEDFEIPLSELIVPISEDRKNSMDGIEFPYTFRRWESNQTRNIRLSPLIRELTGLGEVSRMSVVGDSETAIIIVFTPATAQDSVNYGFFVEPGIYTDYAVWHGRVNSVPRYGEHAKAPQEHIVADKDMIDALTQDLLDASRIALSPGNIQ